MDIRRNKKGFTLLEIIIVIIIVGVLAGLALPRFFATVEYSRANEALAALKVIRDSLERCYLQRAGTYSGCGSFTELDVDDPGQSPGAHFTYSFRSVSNTGYTIRATRNTVDGGSTSSYIELVQTTSGVTRRGAGAFKGIK